MTDTLQQRLKPGTADDLVRMPADPHHNRHRNDHRSNHGDDNRARRLRILSVSSLFPTQGQPQAGVFVQRRMKAIAQQADIELLRPIPWFPGYRPVTSQEQSQRNGIPVHDRRMFYLPLVLKRLDSLWLRRCIEPTVREQHAERRYDLIDAHFGFPTGVGCVAVGRKLGLPVFVTLRGVEQEEIEQPAIGRLMVQALNEATGCIAVSQRLKDTVVRHGVQEANVTVIPNAVNRDIFSLGDASSARQQLGVPFGRRLVVSVGHLKPVKGFDVLVRATAELMRTHADTRLAIIGSTSVDKRFTDRVRSLIRSHGLEGQVTLEGAAPPERIAQWLQAADVFCLPSHREGSCNAVLESLACGTPVVATPAGDNERVVSAPQYGVIVPFDDVSSLADGLRSTLDRSWDRMAVSQSNSLWSWGDVASRTLDYFHERMQVLA